MKPENLKSDFPAPTKSFHEAILTALDKLPEKSGKPAYYKPLRICLACLLAIILLSTTVFAAVKIYSVFVNNNGNYGLDVVVTESSQVKDKYIKLNIGYLPDKVTSIKGTDKLKYGIDAKEKCFTFLPYRVEGSLTLTNLFVNGYKEYDINSHKTIISDINFGDKDGGYQVCVYFEDKSVLLKIYVSSDVSEAEIIKVVEGLSITKGTADDHTEYSIYSEDEKAEKTDGQPLKTEYVYDTSYKQNADISLCDMLVSIDDIRFLDNVSSLDEDKLYCLFLNDSSFYFDNNKNIIDYERKTIRYGDGINSQNEVLKSETAGRKLMCLSVDIKNPSSAPMEFCLSNILVQYLDKSADNKLHDMTNIDDNTQIQSALSGEIDYNSNFDKSNPKDGYIVNIPANSEKTVTLGYIIDSDLMDKTYICMQDSNYVSGAAGTFSYKCVKALG